MRLNVICLEAGCPHMLDISPDMEVMNIKALLEAETGTPVASMILSFNDRLLDDDERCLSDYGVTEDGLITLSNSSSAVPSPAPVAAPAPMAALGSGAPVPAVLPDIDWSQIQVGPPQPQPQTQGAASHGTGTFQDEEDPLALRERLLADPVQAQILSENNPPMYQELVSGDPQRWVAAYERHREAVAEQNRQRIRMLAADPFDEEAQQQIAENIRMENVESSMRSAMEHNPEAFGQVVMLYITCELNGHPVKAFVDSGAQMTIISETCADRCNIMRLVDRRFAGVARGVGEQKIIGRIHMGQLKIGGTFLQASFSVLQEQSMDLLIGLDLLKRHQCCIDLQRGVLRIGSTGSDAPFLAEKDLPASARLATAQDALSPRHAPAGDPTAAELADRELAQALAESARAQEAAASPQAALPSPAPVTSPAAAQMPVLGVVGTPSPATVASDPGITEESIRRLLGMGYSRQDSIAALRENNGNVDLALMQLFASALGGVVQ